jgi:hypothetical protein
MLIFINIKKAKREQKLHVYILIANKQAIYASQQPARY